MSVRARGTTGLQVEISAGRHRLVADEPAGVGDDAGPDPYDLLLGALGACTVMTLQLYARRKGWPLEGVDVALRHQNIHARDCSDCEGDPNARIAVIELELALRGALDPDQADRLRRIAERCPVHRTLVGEIKIRTSLAGGEAQKTGSSGG
ncbi:MAG: OsmC family protein [Deferrisomatales bacterium]|nr:OsmC family protein [Deferrisomatales bacterium]